jgi:2-keto-3-deoxy-L-fuconate dehydrogenase
MAGRMEGKRAFVTAAGQGIGRAVAKAYAREGATVIATSLTMPKLESLRAEHPGVIEIETLNVTDNAAIGRLAARIDAIDVLANCAGYVADGTILDCDDETWDRTFDINVTSIFHLCKAFLPGMLQAKCGSIINVASVAGSIKGVPRRFSYAASKAAVIGLTKAIAMDFVSTGVRCNAIAPGTTDSPSLRERMAAGGSYEETRKQFIARQPMGRLGKPEEIAELAVYLGSDESAFTTGAVFVADGGQTL